MTCPAISYHLTNGTCLLFPSCHAASGRAIDTLSICLPVSIFYDLLQWLTPFMCKSCHHCVSAGFGKDMTEPVWHHHERCLFDLQVSECHAQGDRCGVHGYNVNVLSPWRPSIAFESEKDSNIMANLHFKHITVGGGGQYGQFAIRAARHYGAIFFLLSCWFIITA